MISIILPTFNEKDNIVLLINSISRVFHEIGNNNYEIVIVDDNSPDGTSEIVSQYNNKDKKVKLIIRKVEKGLGTAIKTGIENSIGDYILIMDSDLSHPPVFIKEIIRAMRESDLDAVIASRYIKGGSVAASKYKYILSKAMNLMLMIMLNIKIRDLTGGFFIIKKSLLEKVDLEKVFIGYGDYFYRLFYELKKEKYSFKEIPFHYEKRKAGTSKTNTFKMGIDYIKTMFLLRLGK